MSKLVMNVLLPSAAHLAIIGLYLTPLTLIDCLTRGIISLAIVLVSLGVGIVLGIRGLRARMAGIPGSGWWMVSMCILALPALLVLGPLG
jgi:hypothetical protein